MKHFWKLIFALAIFVSCTEDSEFVSDSHADVGDNVKIHVMVKSITLDESCGTRGYFGDMTDGQPFDFVFEGPNNPTETGDRFGVVCLEDDTVNIPLSFAYDANNAEYLLKILFLTLC